MKKLRPKVVVHARRTARIQIVAGRPEPPPPCRLAVCCLIAVAGPCSGFDGIIPHYYAADEHICTICGHRFGRDVMTCPHCGVRFNNTRTDARGFIEEMDEEEWWEEMEEGR